MTQHDPRKIRERLGVDQNALLSPKDPQPIIFDDTLMDLLTHEAFFTPEECAKIIEGVAPEDWRDHTHEDEWRHSQTVWIPKDSDTLWIFDKMLALVMSANQHKFQFEIDFFEAIQLAKYTPGMYYDWHSDIGFGLQGNRKLSCSVQLSSPEDYEGGFLEFKCPSMFRASAELGSVTVFPSFMKHRVTPVAKGERYSLVVWCSGTNRFR